MVKLQKKHNAKSGLNQGQNEGQEEPAKIGPNTHYEYCSERLSPFGGLLALEKFMDTVKFQEVMCALFGVERLPHVTTYWRYVASLGINQGKSLLLVMAALRDRV